MKYGVIYINAHNRGYIKGRISRSSISHSHYKVNPQVLQPDGDKLVSLRYLACTGNVSEPLTNREKELRVNHLNGRYFRVKDHSDTDIAFSKNE